MAIAARSARNPAGGAGAATADVSLRLGDGTPVWLRSSEPASARDERAEVVAYDSEGRVVGRARYRRVYGPRAVLTLDVDEGWRSRGLLEALLARLGNAATAGGIATFLLRVQPSDARLLSLLVDDLFARATRDGSLVDVELDACVVRADRAS